MNVILHGVGTPTSDTVGLVLLTHPTTYLLLLPSLSRALLQQSYTRDLLRLLTDPKRNICLIPLPFVPRHTVF